jgi:hypothetical protein
MVQWGPYVSFQAEILESGNGNEILVPDSLIIKRSGLARVTAVARGNYDIVNGEAMTYHFDSFFFPLFAFAIRICMILSMSIVLQIKESNSTAASMEIFEDGSQIDVSLTSFPSPFHL